MSKKIKKTGNLTKNINETAEEIDDVVFEHEENQTGNDAIKKLREKLKQAVAEKQVYLTGWQRAKADLINTKKEFGAEQMNLLKFANSNLILQIIPVLDSFEMAFSNIKKDDKKLKEWLIGAQHIYNQLLFVLKENGLEPIKSINEKFNPKFHHSVGTVQVENKKDENIIMEITQKGYTLNDRVIREAKVKVGEFEK